jgi:hypothetical protein
MKVWMYRGLFAAAGAAAGFAYYTFIGCTTGSCPITSNPYLMTAYGAVVGVVLTPSRAGTPKQ